MGIILKQKSRQLCIEEFREKTNQTRKNTKLLPSDCKPRDQNNDISSQNASKREQKKQILYKETNLTIAKKKNTKTKGLFYFNKNQFLKKITLLSPINVMRRMYEKNLYS